VKKFLFVVACSFFAMPALAETVGEKTGINSTLGIAPTTKDFVQEAAVSDMFEIQSSKLASSKLSGEEKSFADKMIADHTKTSSQLTQGAQTANVPLPTGLDSAHQKMLDTLSSESGDAFRRDYFSDQVSAHKDAVSLFQRYSDKGDNANLKSWATTTLPALQHHLDMAKGLYKDS
jgi:putative membrane protein